MFLYQRKVNFLIIKNWLRALGKFSKSNKFPALENLPIILTLQKSRMKSRKLQVGVTCFLFTFLDVNVGTYYKFKWELQQIKTVVRLLPIITHFKVECTNWNWFTMEIISLLRYFKIVRIQKHRRIEFNLFLIR